MLKSPFTEKLGFWRKMAKIWHKVQENGTKKIRLAKLVAKEKKNLAQTLALISFAVTEKLICVFVFAYAKIRFSYDEAYILSFSKQVLVSLSCASITLIVTFFKRLFIDNDITILKAH